MRAATHARKSIGRPTRIEGPMEHSEFCSGKDYQDKFDPYTFLRQYASLRNSQHMLRCFHGAFQNLPSNITVLDYGSGPSLRGIVSAAVKASEITLSDYSVANRRALGDWLENKCDAFDWNPHFSYVVRELEGMQGDDEVAKRQQEVRKIVKAVVECDLKKDPPIEAAYNKLYDVVVSTYVVETIAKSYDEYCSLVSRMTRLVKPPWKPVSIRRGKQYSRRSHVQ